MTKNKYIIWIIAATALIVTGGVGCKRTITPQPDPNQNLVPVMIAPTVAQSEASADKAVSRLTPSTSATAGAFEANDAVGLFLYDRQNTNFSTVNMRYRANSSLKFAPDNKVFYKTYYQHDIYAYFPYVSDKTDAKVVPFLIKTDQTDPKDRIACDFLAAVVQDVKPQQIDPDAPEIQMDFCHQMTSIVVWVKNEDGRPVSPNFTTKPVKVWLAQRASEVNVDLTTVDADKNCKLTPGSTKNNIVLGHNKAKDVGNTLFFEGIAIPEAVVAGKDLIKIQIGKDGASDAFVLPYNPKTNDAIVTSGLTQGKEHIFTLTIKGTKLSVQGGEINEWGTGASVSENINGGGVTTTRLIFELENEYANTNLTNITKCKLKLDGIEYTGDATYTAKSGPNAARLECSINTGAAFPYWFIQATFSSDTGAEILKTTPVSDKTIRIKGNPLDPDYKEVLATIDVNDKTVQ